MLLFELFYNFTKIFFKKCFKIILNEILKVMKELEEQELMQQCVQAMLEDEREIYNIHNQIASPPSSQQWSTATNCSPALINNLPDLCQGVENLQVRDNLVKHSTLNPNAAEFVPRRRPTRLAGPASYLPKNS
ncbi:Protein of unknown function [Gryllus bimaculatus]|nr:Protein of unknown function [Gryllus bimaculatus]